MNTPPVIPPFRFATVDAGRAVAGRSAEASGVESVYRSAYPSLRNYRFLLGLDLQTIVSLVPSSEPVKDLAEFCELNSITHRHIQVPRFRDEVTVTSALTSQLLGELVDTDRQPLLIHCVDGKNITGLVVMCLRKLQNWSRSTIHAEFSRFVPGGPAAAESQFLDGFQGDAATVHLPEATPSWLWSGVRCSRHPTITLVHHRDAEMQGRGGTGIIRERLSGEEEEEEADESADGGLSGRGRAVLEGRGGGDVGRRDARGQGAPRGPWQSTLPTAGRGAGKALPSLPGLRNDEDEEEEEDEEEDEDGEASLGRGGGALANPKTGLGPVREAVQQLEGMEQLSQTISALALEGLELSNPSRNYL